jgi:indole-3-glycerol phosphate synthase
MGLLGDILTQKAAEVAALSASPPGARAADAPRDVVTALRRPAGEPLRLIAEIKFRSPSAGTLSRVLGPAERAFAYEQGGASLVSVLTDRKWFDGSFDDLAAARARVSVPVLCKDFRSTSRRSACIAAGPTLCSSSFAVCAGALAAARRRRARGDRADRGGRRRARARGGLAAGARVVGCARSRPLEVDHKRAKRVLASIPKATVAVHLSGLKSGRDVAAVATSRADAALIGEALMRCDDPRPLLAELARGAAGNAPPPSKS